jgi:hypothetical protein
MPPAHFALVILEQVIPFIYFIFAQARLDHDPPILSFPP